MKFIIKLLVLVMISYFVYVYIILKPSNDKAWELEFQTPSTVEFIDEDRVKINHIHDWEYTDEFQTSVRYFDETYNMKNLRRVWFVLEPFSKWQAVAHTYFVFDFQYQEPIAFSIEARREVNEAYSGGAGLVGGYELYYSWGTERDFTGKRAYRDNATLYMYPLKLSGSRMINLFKTLAEETNTLADHPRFYNTLFDNCTNELAKIVRKANPAALPWYSLYVLPGYADYFLYDHGYIDTRLSKNELRQMYNITDIVRQNYKEGFSDAIRDVISVAVLP
ncbi:MAG: hypothetical protein UU81_C0013G0025 [Microgenomates group bacterium GW2011_GWC1_41_8]|uniref:Lnb N-terminal periplasmic domain-containing protein n=3 Tax=Candidatus Roizmaniibacteriota TaxID=1752723 RepID=A0A0G0XB55_9BACT|nr:MAG: hypothetical protein UT85_C0005G0022 [Candidatus Levybacteria bacterium GW2011_GWA2_40_16]KKR94821.1 MAG: hypothetical protein UU41_C0003G0040 [Candidatus Roizmanbacteria bacterium GW2011_GWA1_41_13]KKS21592.1 MAG: hypothetical protein UU78_C0035G0009 [Candidatus Roizmanbacteria bacterium GW2011_GWC2_41_7]KKS24101.1 MAG: hypothetical protein UU81_C0013G0025 [Microgenomates group bacterium GW2011_GWC1_41_8]